MMIALKTQLMKRAAALCLAVVLTLSVNARLLRRQERPSRREGGPGTGIRTYRAFPITQFHWPRAARERT